MCESIKDGGKEIKLENYLSDSNLPSQQHLSKQYTFKRSSRVKNVKRKTLEYPSLPVKKETTDNLSCSDSVVFNSKSKYRKLTGSFTPEIGYVPNCSQVVLYIQEIKLRFYELNSLDTYISDEEVNNLSKKTNFRNGWLYDSIIDAFNLKIMQGKDCFASRCYHTQILESGGNLGNFFSPNKLKATEFLFIPINVSYHWVLLVANLSLKKLNFYDPLGFGTEGKYINLSDRFMEKKLNILFCEEHDWPVSYPVHVKQTDSMNCGVFISYFTNRILEKNNIVDTFDTNEFRKFMYNSITVFSSIVREFLEQFYNLWRTVLAKNKIVLDSALRLQSFRIPENATIGVRGGVECQQQERWRPSSRLF
ncbi:ULP_PROTEASE domain-containing protein [Trichonephila clavipes]|nr:ULP_PROTEASE domain-containing protein [Trichonephila clavipes]